MFEKHLTAQRRFVGRRIVTSSESILCDKFYDFFHTRQRNALECWLFECQQTDHLMFNVCEHATEFIWIN